MKILHKIIKKLFPQTPSVLIVFTCILSINNSSAQLTSIDSNQFELIKQYNNKLMKNEIVDYKMIRKYDFMNFVPAIQINKLYGFGLSFNVLDVYKYYVAKQVQKQDVKKIQNNYTIKTATDQQEYLQLKEQLEISILLLAQQKQLFVFQKRLFKIDSIKFVKNELHNYEYINKQITIKQIIFAIKKAELDIKNQTYKLSNLSYLN